jgi:mRNA-degrading endonuclease RelE of RelBE toxin-antitoxin system
LSKVQFRESAERELDRLSRVQQQAIYNKLKSLESDPCHADAKALEDYVPPRRIKKADVRAIYDPEPPDASRRIFIWRISVSHSIYDFEELSQYQSDR